jgi:chemotaxis protein CheD
LSIVVGMADMTVTADPTETITTHALGSCLGITLYDPVARVGGLLHVMLPDSSIDPRKANERPMMFVDLGIPCLFRAAYALGAKKPRIVVKVAGGATTKADPKDDFFRIGERNFVALRKLLWKNNVLIEAYDVGGMHSRTMVLSMANGEVNVHANGAAVPLTRREEVYPCH